MRYNRIKRNLAITVIIAFICTLSSEGFMYMFNSNDFLSGVSAAKIARIVCIGIMLFALVARLVIESTYESENLVEGDFTSVMSTRQSA